MTSIRRGSSRHAAWWPKTGFTTNRHAKSKSSTGGQRGDPPLGATPQKKPNELYAQTSRDPWALTREVLLGLKQLQD